MTTATTRTPGADPRARPHRPGGLWPGLGLCLLIAAGATLAGTLVPAFGAPLFAITAGAAVAMMWRVPDRFVPGLAFCSRPVLQASVVILGSGLAVTQVLAVGASSLPVLVGTLAVALLLARPVGRALGLSADLTDLVGVGTAICGASAIAAVDSVIDADDSDVSYAVATIFLFNVVALLTYPTLGRALGLSQHAFGLWAGTAINDLSSVVAASSIYGHAATSQAVVVKLTRTLAIIPISVWLSATRGRRRDRGSVPLGPPTGGRAVVGTMRRAVPLFLLGFLAAAAINSAGLIPAGWHPGLSQTANGLITVALAAIGLSTRPAAMKAAGWRPLALGAVLWASVGAASLLLQGFSAWAGI